MGRGVLCFGLNCYYSFSPSSDPTEAVLALKYCVRLSPLLHAMEQQQKQHRVYLFKPIRLLHKQKACMQDLEEFTLMLGQLHSSTASAADKEALQSYVAWCRKCPVHWNTMATALGFAGERPSQALCFGVLKTRNTTAIFCLDSPILRHFAVLPVDSGVQAKNGLSISIFDIRGISGAGWAVFCKKHFFRVSVA